MCDWRTQRDDDCYWPRQWETEADAVDFVRDAFKHCKAVMATGEAVSLLEAAHIPTDKPDGPDPSDDATIVAPKMTQAVAKRFVAALARPLSAPAHRRFGECRRK